MAPCLNILRVSLLVTVASLLGTPSEAARSAMPVVRELTDLNFEHDTQATTGSTTGDWLILFCEFERLKTCRDYEHFWNELAGVLRG
mmetsp:Transcript_30725/g.38017  ORF Transcript_30725/g.38017 Transcript_30725/m.38017 type:complete len:87 (+) Transcript_30725:28-288(+)